MITILDYGINNLHSISRAVALVGGEAEIRTDVGSADRLIIPGVGAFAKAMSALSPVVDEIRAFAKSGKPVMGICLGMQLLFEESEELGFANGLGLLKGSIKYLPKDTGLKIPHMGWSPLTYRSHEGIASEGVDGEQVYFVHSLAAVCATDEDILATADYAREFPAMVRNGNVWGTQFHPEKSGAIGLRMLRKFIEC